MRRVSLADPVGGTRTSTSNNTSSSMMASDTSRSSMIMSNMMTNSPHVIMDTTPSPLHVDSLPTIPSLSPSPINDASPPQHTTTPVVE
jgi:hypothetical protein